MKYHCDDSSRVLFDDIVGGFIFKNHPGFHTVLIPWPTKVRVGVPVFANSLQVLKFATAYHAIGPCFSK